MERDFPEDQVVHRALVRPVPKMDTPTGLFAGGCTCGWRSSGLESSNGARRSAEQHVNAKSRVTP